MLKMILLGIIVLASIGLGNTVYSEVADRRKFLKEMLNSVKCVKNAMVFENMPISFAFEHSAKNKVFEECAQEIIKNPSRPVYGICKDKIEEFAEPTDEDKKAFCSFIYKLSISICPANIEDAAETYMRDLSEQLKEIDAVHIKKGKVYKTMCILSGIVIAVIMV